MQTVVGSACQKLDQTPRPGRPASAVNQQLSIISEINHPVPPTSTSRGSDIAALTSSHPPAAPRSHRVPQGPARDTAARSHRVPQTRRHGVTGCLRHGGTESQGASDTAARSHRVPQTRRYGVIWCLRLGGTESQGVSGRRETRRQGDTGCLSGRRQTRATTGAARPEPALSPST